jgi:hypothetical protein
MPSVAFTPPQAVPAPQARSPLEGTFLLFLGIFVVASLMPAQTDTWWQLRTGEEMWWTHRVMLRDVFTHTIVGGYWPNHEWLAQILFYAVYRVGGLPLLTAFCASAVVATWGLIYAITPGNTPFRLSSIAIAAALSTAGWSLRPQVLTFFLFALTLWILVHRRYVIVLPLVFVMWANFHGGVAAGGLVLVGATVAALVVARQQLARLLAVSTACVLATAATPLGFSLWWEVPASLERLKRYDVSEWRAAQLTNPADWPFWAALAALVIIGLRNRARLKNAESLTLVISAVLAALLAIRSTRNVAFFLMCAVPATARLLSMPASNAASRSPRGFTWLAGAATVTAAAFVAYAWVKPLPRLLWKPLSAGVFRAVETCPGPLYNRYDEGGELIWFARDRPVFLDSRQDPFPEAFVMSALRVEQSGEFEEVFDRYHIRCALTPADSVLAKRLSQSGWNSIPTGSAAWRVYEAPRSKP